MKRRGTGMASIFYGTGYGNGFPDVSSAVVEIHDDGSATVLTGAADCGQGSSTVLAQIAAAELGISMERVTLIAADTDCTPDAGTTAATRQTYTSGNAVRLAAQRAKGKVFEYAAGLLGVNTPEGLCSGGDRIWVKGYPDKYMTLSKVMEEAGLAGKRIIGEGSFTSHSTKVDPKTGQGVPYSPYAFGTQIVEVEVDDTTGKVDVIRVTAAHDVGKAIHREGVKGQIFGGVTQGIGWAITEEIQLDKGRITNGNFTEYLIPTSMDVPDMEGIIVETYEETGPFGAKGIGEPALLPTAPAILNAIYDAVGVRITSLPATPEKILAALQADKENS